MMKMVWMVMAGVGFVLCLWAYLSLPKGTDMRPIPPQLLTKKGPYRWLAHPMYLGNTLFVTGCAGYAAGFFNALAIFSVIELLMRDWKDREQPPQE